MTEHDWGKPNLGGELGPIEGNWGGARIEVAYRVIDPATGTVIWPDATTPYDQLFTEDRSYAAALYWLGEGVADHRWLPGASKSV